MKLAKSLRDVASLDVSSPSAIANVLAVFPVETSRRFPMSRGFDGSNSTITRLGRDHQAELHKLRPRSGNSLPAAYGFRAPAAGSKVAVSMLKTKGLPVLS